MVKKITMLSIFLSIIFVNLCFAKVAASRLEELVEQSDYIVIGKITEIINIENVKVAKVEVIRNLKGCNLKTVYYLAQPTWTCDSSTAIVGEISLLFLYDMGKEEKIPTDPNVIIIGRFVEPPKFRMKYKEISGNAPFLALSYSGRGRMQLKKIGKVDYVISWDDVILPDNLKKESKPTSRYSIYQYTPIKSMLEYIEEKVKKREKVLARLTTHCSRAR